jgi:hypothetical protein
MILQGIIIPQDRIHSSEDLIGMTALTGDTETLLIQEETGSHTIALPLKEIHPHLMVAVIEITAPATAVTPAEAATPTEVTVTLAEVATLETPAGVAATPETADTEDQGKII